MSADQHTIDERWLDPPRFKGGPPICRHANLPAFTSIKEQAKFDDRTCGEHPLPTMARWTCAKCGGIHSWHGGETDSNGGFSGGGDRLPERIMVLVREASWSWILPSAKDAPPPASTYGFRGQGTHRPKFLNEQSENAFHDRQKKRLNVKKI